MKNLYRDLPENALFSKPPSPDDLRLIHQREIEAAELRQKYFEINLQKLLKLGEELRKLKG